MKGPSSNMDDQSRDAAQNIRIAFNNTAWHKMERLLDEADKKRIAQVITNRISAGITPGKNRRWSALFLLFIFTGTAILLIKSNTVPKTNAGQVVNINDRASVRTNVRYNTGTSTSQKAEAKEIDNGHLRYLQFEKKHHPGKNFKSNATFDKKTSLVLMKYPSYRKEKPVTDDGGVQEAVKNYFPKDIQNDDQGDVVIIDTENEAKGVTVDVLEKTRSLLANTAINPAKKLKDSTLQKMKTISAANKKDVVNTARIKKNERPAASKNKIFKNAGFAVFASPELNTVQFKGSGRITISYGAGLNYSIGKNFTFQALFVNSRKLYAADRRGYSPIAGSSLVYADTLQVNADCKIWDIPVSLRYSFTGNSKSSFFISAGISSYIMKKEIYNFTYYEQGEYKTKQRIIENENKHSFCNLNFSAGYQYWLNKKWSIGFEPYLKLPLNGIGLGKVKLTSAGALFSLTFKPW